ncbi:MAG: hypothetical protein LBK94_11250 [Prevotellaceae bacterium]|jgi:hypothetical protein|nr:hypothetical protein [Prevotellaceae bacterium]
MILIEGINYNEAWAKSVTKEDFVAHFGRFAYGELTGAERSEKLSGIYDLLTGNVKKEQPKGTKRQSAE